MNNYRVDVFTTTNTHYMTEFAEYWLAKVFANAVKDESGIQSVYMLERISDKSFDITRRIK
nr:MAG TPA: hypothetical protein [Caudoviricetes sp.]